jgi:pSer/pThr/pTyr-binding forkhead associated (FHA) protein
VVTAEALPPGATPKLVCVRGLRTGVEYPVYEGENFIGRSDEQPVDIDLDDQERPENIWSSRQHAVIRLENGVLTIEDLKSANHTYVNRTRAEPGTKVALKVGDLVQIGGIHLKVQLA